MNPHLNKLLQQLQDTILSLQSNQIIQQMKNDPTLHQYKITYIQELIREHLDISETLDNLTFEMEQLKLKVKEKDALIDSMRHEYSQELQNIQSNCHRLILNNQVKIKEKEDHILQYKNSYNILQEAQKTLKSELKKYQQQEYKVNNDKFDLNHELKRYQEEKDTLAIENQRLKQQNESLRGELNQVKSTNKNLKQDRSQLQQLKFKQQQAIVKLKKENLQKIKTFQKEFHLQHDQKNNKLITQYQSIILKLKNDMSVIKECWQRKCQETQNKYQEEFNMMSIKYQEKMRRQLKEYAENIQQGKSVVINDSEELINKRVGLIEGTFRQSLEKYTEKINLLEENQEQYMRKHQQQQLQLKQLKNQILKHKKQSQKQKKQSQKQKKQAQKALITKQKQLANLQQQFKQLSSIKKQLQNKLTHQNKNNHRQLLKQQEQKQTLLKNINKISKQKEELQKQQRNLNKKLDLQLKKAEEYKKQILEIKQTIIKKEQHIVNRNIQIQTLKKNAQLIDSNSKDMKKELQERNILIKRQKEKRKQMMSRMDKLYFIVRKISKQNYVLKEEIPSRVQTIKNKFNNLLASLMDHIHQFQDSFVRKHKTQMNDLLDQMQVKQKQLFESIQAQKEELKHHKKEYQNELKIKETDLHNLKLMVYELQNENRALHNDLQRSRLNCIKLQQKIDLNDQVYQSNINKLQKDISRTMSSFNHKWTEQISRTQQELQTKDQKLKVYAEKIDNLNQENEQSKKEHSWMEQQLKKSKKKYQNLKGERDEKIEGLLKKLELEAKHRLNLQKELKQLRITIMKGPSHYDNISFSFGDKERDSNTKYNTNTHGKQSIDKQKQKELSQIKELIAKTYKVVDGPAQRDISRNFSKKNLF